MAIKILVAADLHLGKRTSGLAAFDDKCSTKQTWQRIVDFSCNNNIDVVLLAGDVVDRDNRYYEASGALQEGFRRLGAEGIEVFLVAGNHDFDVLPQILRNHPFDYVHLLGLGGTWEVFPFEKGGEALQFVGWSFNRPCEQGSPLAGIRGVTIDPNRLSIGLLHADVDTLDSRYGPVPLIDLQQTPVDVWMLGHIHKPMVFNGEKVIRYPGSPQALSAKEQGVHGCLVMTIEGGRMRNVEEVGFSNCRFDRLTVDVTPVDSEERLRLLLETELSSHANEGLMELDNMAFLVYDLHLTGRNNRGLEIERWAAQLKGGYELRLATGTRVLVREIAATIRPAVEDLETLARERSPAGILAETILALRAGRSTPFLEELLRDWEVQSWVVGNSSGFQPLQAGFQRYENSRSAGPYIEEECNRLLVELLFPTN